MMPTPVYNRDERYRCPNCDYEEHWDSFESIGACMDNVFCPRCGTEFDPVTLETHYPDPAACEGCRRTLEEFTGFRPTGRASILSGCGRVDGR